MTETPHIDWSDIEGLSALIEALGGPDKARLVGGCVRDRLLGVPVGDIDIATVHLPEATMALLDKAGIKAIPTGIDHGTVTAVIDGHPFEITTLRSDVATDGRHAVVRYSDDWAEDAARRDFTINALYSDAATGTVFDYTDGLSDIEGPHVRFIGDPAQRIAEDHLRILRYFRFLARFGAQTPDPAALAACHEARKSLMTLSRERVSGELMRLLAADDPSDAIAQMDAIDLFESFLPEIGEKPGEHMRALVTVEAECAVEARAERRLSLLLPPEKRTIEKVAARLKLSNKLRQSLVDIAQARARLPDLPPRPLAYRHGIDAARDAVLIESALSGRDMSGQLSTLSGWVVPQLPIKGGELIRRGVAAGPEVSRLLRQIEDRWVEEGFPENEGWDAIVRDSLTSSTRGQ